MKPRLQKPICEYSFANPFKLIYVSTVDEYKHQWNVVEAVSNIKKLGYPVTLDLYGSGNKRALKSLKETIYKYDKNKKFIRF